MIRDHLLIEFDKIKCNVWVELEFGQWKINLKYRNIVWDSTDNFVRNGLLLIIVMIIIIIDN